MRLPFRKAFAAMRLPPVGLQLRDKNAFAVAAGGFDALFARAQRAGHVLRFAERHGMENFRVRAENARRGAGPRDQRANLVDDLRAASRPVNGRKLAREHGAYVACDSSCGTRCAVPF